MTPEQRMEAIDTLLSHVWMVRTFVKHADETAEDEDLQEVHRTLYDCMHALGAPYAAGDSAAYLKQARKKIGKLRQATELFLEVQPEVSGHMNFRMAARSLQAAIEQVAALLAS